MNIRPYSIIYFIFFSVIFLLGCNKERFSKIETQNINIQLIRFEEELFNSNLYSFQDSISVLNKKYPNFLPLFGNKIIEIGDPSQPWFNDALFSFRTDQAIYNIYKRVSSVHKDLSSTQNKLTTAFGKWKTIFPDKNTPEIFTYISGFNQSIVTTDSILGISLEKYLGRDEELYTQVYPIIPAYQRYNMTPDRIPVDIVRAWGATQIEYKPEKDNLLSQMIYNGQILFLTNKLLSDTPDSLLFGYSPKQLEFCITEEKNMWTYLIEQKLLFSTDKFKVGQFINDAPFTKDFNQDSPGKAALWLGYRIVEQYAKKRKDLSLAQIVTESDFQLILSDSGYRPL